MLFSWAQFTYVTMIAVASVFGLSVISDLLLQAESCLCRSISSILIIVTTAQYASGSSRKYGIPEQKI